MFELETTAGKGMKLHQRDPHCINFLGMPLKLNQPVSPSKEVDFEPHGPAKILPATCRVQTRLLSTSSAPVYRSPMAAMAG